MPFMIVWSESSDEVIRAARRAGVGWQEIAHRIGVSRTALLDRARAIGLSGSAHTPVSPPKRRDPVAFPPEPAAIGPARPPLPPGHELTWGSITTGTLLAGTAYPQISLDTLARSPRNLCNEQSS